MNFHNIIYCILFLIILSQCCVYIFMVVILLLFWSLEPGAWSHEKEFYNKSLSLF